MLTKRIIPCIDVDLDDAGNAAVYTGVNFEDLEYTGDPVQMAKKYNRAGADEFVFLDITASAEGRETMLHVVEQVADEVFIPLTVGGGIRTREDIKETLRAGADKVSINTAAVREPDLVRRAAEWVGSQCIVVAIDAKQVDTDAPRWSVFTHGGRRDTGIDALEWARRMVALGAGELLVTSMDRDGTKAGFDTALTRAISDSVDVPVIASGGVGTLEHLSAGVLDGHADAVLAASIFHFATYSIAEAKAAMGRAGIVMRQDNGAVVGSGA